jgi:hypothetical protein
LGFGFDSGALGELLEALIEALVLRCAQVREVIDAKGGRAPTLHALAIEA